MPFSFSSPSQQFSKQFPKQFPKPADRRALYGMLLAGAAMLLSFNAHATVPAAPSGPPSAASTEPASPRPSAAPDVRVYSVTRAVGEVGEHIVTSREVRAHEAVQIVMSGLPVDTQADNMKLPQVTDRGFPAAITRVLDEWTVVLSVRDLGVTKPDAAEVERLVKDVQEKWKGARDFVELELTPAELREVVERQLLAESVLRLKSDESLVTITDAEALQHYKKNRSSYGDRSFEDMRESIKARLAKVQTERRLIEWRQSLRRRYKVRNFFGT